MTAPVGGVRVGKPAGVMSLLPVASDTVIVVFAVGVPNVMALNVTPRYADRVRDPLGPDVVKLPVVVEPPNAYVTPGDELADGDALGEADALGLALGEALALALALGDGLALAEALAVGDAVGAGAGVELPLLELHAANAAATTRGARRRTRRSSTGSSTKQAVGCSLQDVK